MKFKEYITEENPNKESIKKQIAFTVHQIKNEKDPDRKNRLRIKYDKLQKELRKR
jgi:hypothetical protein